MKRQVQFLVSLLPLSGCALGPAPADPAELNWPPHEPLVNGRLVTVEVIYVNGQKAPGRSLEKAIQGFSKYVAGEVRTVEGEVVQLEVDEDGLLSKRQLDALIAKRRYRGASDVTVIFVPGLSDYVPGLSSIQPRWFCIRKPNGSHVVVIQRRAKPATGAVSRTVERFLSLCGRIVLAPLLPREKDWQRTMQHEMLHALGVPYDRSHAWRTRHCTHPECLLYPRPDVRWVLTAIFRLGPPFDLCRACQGEIRRVQEAAGPLIDPQEPYDDMERLDALVRLNPDRALAYAYRAEGHWKRGDLQKAIADLTRAIELDPGEKTGMCYRNRGVLFTRLGEFERGMGDWRRCLQLDPDDARALNYLASVLATCPRDGIRNGSRAVELARRACELTEWNDAEMLDTLAAAYAEVGQFDRAIEYQGKALSLAAEKQAGEYHQRLESYRAGKPRRDSAQ